MKIYGYPSGKTNQWFRTEQEAIAYKERIGGTTPDIVHYPGSEYSTESWEIEQGVHYRYTFYEEEAILLRNKGHYSEFNIIETEIEVIAKTSKKKLFIFGELPYHLGGSKGYRFLTTERILNFRESSCIEIPDTIPTLTDCAEGFIQTLKGADSKNNLHDGLTFETICSIDRLLSTEVIAKGLPRSPFQPQQIDECRYLLLDGDVLTLYEYSVGYSEGYLFEVYLIKKNAFTEMNAVAKIDWVLTECLECGAIYDEVGHVEPGGMGCDRCN